METHNLNDIRFTKDGQVFFLHHSRNPDIKVGESIKASTGINQVTANDALSGYSYAWDPYGEGIEQAVNNQASAHHIYLTSAPVESVYPDMNIPGSPARAIAGEQKVIDKVDLSDLLENRGQPDFFNSMEMDDIIKPNLEKSESRILDMFKKHGLPAPNVDRGAAEALNVGMSLSDRGVTMAASHYRESLNALAAKMGDTFSRGNLAPAYREGGAAHYQYRAWQEGGNEALVPIIDKVSGDVIRGRKGFTAYAELSERHSEVLGKDLTQMVAHTSEGKLSRLALRDVSEVAQAVTKGSRGSRALRSLGLRRLLR